MSNLDPIKVKFKGDLNDLRTSFTRAHTESRKATARIRKDWEMLGQQLARTGKKMSVGITAPFIAFGTATTKAFKDFERNLQTIVGLVGIAQSQVDKWRGSILALGPAVGRGPVELSEAMFFITSAGLRGQAALDALTDSARASSAGLGETKSVALAVVSAMNTWSASGMTAAMATDTLVKTIREGNLEAASLSSTLGKVLGTAKAAGASFEDIGGAIAVMTRQGVNAEMATTALNSVFSLMLASGKQASQALASVGLSTAGLRQQMGEEGLLSVLRTLDEALQGDVEALKMVVPNMRAMRAVLSILGQDAETVSTIFDSVKNSTGALEEAFGAMAGTVDLRVNKASARMQGAMIRFGDTLKRVTVPATEAFSNVLDDVSLQLSGMSDASKEMIAAAVGITAAIGPILIVVGGLSMAFAKLKAAAIVTTAIAGMKDSLFLLTGGFKTGLKAGTIFTQMLTKTTAIAGGGTIALAALAIGYTLVMKSVRKANEALDEQSAAFLRASEALKPMKQRIEELKTANFEMFQEWKSRVDALRAADKNNTPTPILWAAAFKEMADAGGEAARAVSNATKAAAASADVLKDMRDQLEELRLSVRTPGEVLDETLESLEGFRIALEAVGIEGEEVEEILTRAARAATAEFKSASGEMTKDISFITDALQQSARIAEMMADKSLRKMKERLQESKAEGMALREQFEQMQISVRTPLEELRASLGELEELRIKLKEIGTAGTEVDEVLHRMATQIKERFNESTRQVEDTSDAVKQLGMTFSSALEDAIVAGKGLRGILHGLEEDILRIFVRMSITEPLGQALAAGFGGLIPSAKGNVFASGRAQPFGDGGVIGAPVAFPTMGGMGIAGENGPEGILPLRRNSRGQLGVEASGGGGTIIQLSQTNVFEVHTIDSRDTGRFFDENAGKISSIILREARNSVRFKQQLMRGG